VGVIGFELACNVNAPTSDVFARLSDINGHNEWMPKKGSIFRTRSRHRPEGRPPDVAEPLSHAVRLHLLAAGEVAIRVLAIGRVLSEHVGK
jgi:hypothetical protein